MNPHQGVNYVKQKKHLITQNNLELWQKNGSAQSADM